MTSQQKIIDRCRGCLYGLAIGDALGAPVEFQRPGSFEPVTGYRAGGPWNLNAGEWTDDTSMALALADSIATVGWDIEDQARRYCDWWLKGKYSVNGRCFDIGSTCARSLMEFRNGTDVRQCAPTHEQSSGNGCIMRIAPVAIMRSNKSHSAIHQTARESSLVTHGSELCLSCSEYLVTLLKELISNGSAVSKEAFICSRACRTIIQNNLLRSILVLQFTKSESIRGTGYVLDCLQAALWAFLRSSSFEECVLKAVNLGEDADTTGAVAGQIAGAYYGESGIPKHLLDGLARKDMIENALTGLGVGKEA